MHHEKSRGRDFCRNFSGECKNFLYKSLKKSFILADMLGSYSTPLDPLAVIMGGEGREGERPRKEREERVEKEREGKDGRGGGTCSKVLRGRDARATAGVQYQ